MVGAVIITYNPSVKVLNKNIEKLMKEKFKIVIVDNCSTNKKEIIDLNLDVFYILNDENKGIATAMNQGFDYLYQKGIKWAISFDQDSEYPDHFLDEAKVYMDKDVGIICPQVYDKKFDGFITPVLKENEKYRFVKKCISSCSLTNLEIWKEINGFDDQMFIDYVDFDFCMKLRLKNYKIIRVKNSILLHELGNCTFKNFLGHKIRISNHSSKRKYYIGRNIVVYIRRYSNQLSIVEDLFSLFKVIIFIVCFEKNKRVKLYNLFIGIKDGLLYKV